ncbi:hypothetical protein DNTS_003601 [Danionella cerebrum]|uniref:Uncharacterized protein n=1 Tax=Danionella cerebrum TaxID=2873325 RepID=A0A553RHQ5_9TELE|nr:hypothetical protein DNTS_003601 [Danionella translucida]
MCTSGLNPGAEKTLSSRAQSSSVLDEDEHAGMSGREKAGDLLVGGTTNSSNSSPRPGPHMVSYRSRRHRFKTWQPMMIQCLLNWLLLAGKVVAPLIMGPPVEEKLQGQGGCHGAVVPEMGGESLGVPSPRTCCQEAQPPPLTAHLDPDSSSLILEHEPVEKAPQIPIAISWWKGFLGKPDLQLEDGVLVVLEKLQGQGGLSKPWEVQPKPPTLTANLDLDPTGLNLEQAPEMQDLASQSGWIESRQITLHFHLRNGYLWNRSLFKSAGQSGQIMKTCEKERKALLQINNPKSNGSSTWLLDPLLIPSSQTERWSSDWSIKRTWLSVLQAADDVFEGTVESSTQRCIFHMRAL